MGSCLRIRLYIKDLLLGSISGGIIISSPAILLGQSNHIGLSILFGLLSGLLTTLIYIKIGKSNCCSFNDRFGLLSIYFIPGIISHVLTYIILTLNTYHGNIKEVNYTII